MTAATETQSDEQVQVFAKNYSNLVLDSVLCKTTYEETYIRRYSSRPFEE